MTLAKFGQGAALTRAGNAIAEITDVTLPNPKAAVLKVTNHASPSGWEEKIYGLIDGDKVQVTCNFRPDDTNGQMGGLHDHPDTETQRRGREALETYRQVERAYREGRDELRFHRHRVFETMRRHQPGYGGFDPLIQPKEWLAHTYIRSLSDDTEWPNTYVPQAPAGRDR